MPALLCRRALLSSIIDKHSTIMLCPFLLQGSMPTDGTLLLEHMPNGKQYLVTALSVFFSFGAVLSAVVALFSLPQNSCVQTSPCNPDENNGWKHMLGILAAIVCISRHTVSFN